VMVIYAKRQSRSQFKIDLGTLSDDLSHSTDKILDVGDM